MDEQNKEEVVVEVVELENNDLEEFESLAMCQVSSEPTVGSGK